MNLLPSNSQAMQEVRGKHTLDSPVIFRDREEMRGTLDNGEYCISIIVVNYNIYLLMGESEYDTILNDPIMIAVIPLDMSVGYKIRTNQVHEILKLLNWECDDCDYIPRF